MVGLIDWHLACILILVCASVLFDGCVQNILTNSLIARDAVAFCMKLPFIACFLIIRADCVVLSHYSSCFLQIDCVANDIAIMSCRYALCVDL